MNNTNNASARSSYDIAKQILFQAWIASFQAANPGNDAAATSACWAWVNNRKLSQGEIRLEVGLSTTSNTFVFAMTANQNNTSNLIFATENRLNLQDTLVASEYGVFVAKTAGQNDSAYNIRTYGNTQDFTAPSAAALDTTFYANGSFQMKVNNDVVIPYRGLFNHLYRAQTQETAPLGAGSPNDQIRGAEDGFVTQEPNILLIGSKGYVPMINLVGNLASVDANTRAILIFRGINAQNSTSIN
jgi:hypothetical protein